jgi:zinc transport system substrate-binding protein
MIAFLMLALLVCTTLLTSCSREPKVWPELPGKKKVLASFAPLYCFTQAVAGDDANVLCLLATNGPHAADMSHIDIMKVRGADLILSNGLDLDDELISKWVGSASKKVRVVKVGDEAVPDDKLHHIEEEEKHPPGKHEHKHGEHDPHVWLSPVLAKLMVDKIAEELSKLEPAAKERFRQRADAYKAKLDELHKYGLAKFKGRKNLNLVAQHDSLHYFADAFGLKLVGHLRTQAGDEGSLAEGTDLLKKCKATPPAVITVEPQFPEKAPKSLQKTLERDGIVVKLVELDPLETAPLAEGSVNPDPGHYLKRMYENIDNLDKTLP